MRRRKNALTPFACALFVSVPVDPVMLGIPTYFDVIKAPMDLGTVLTRLQRKQYISAGEVLRGASSPFAFRVNVSLRSC